MPDTSMLNGRLTSPRRDEKRMAQLAEALKELGFEVTSVSRWGVGFRGTTSRFEEVFRCKVVPSDRGPTFAGEPTLPASLAEEGAAVYLPSRPDYA